MSTGFRLPEWNEADTQAYKKLKGSVKYTLTWVEPKDYVLWRNIAQNLQVYSCSNKNVDWVLKKTVLSPIPGKRVSRATNGLSSCLFFTRTRIGENQLGKKFCSFFYHWGDLSISDRLLFPPLSVGSLYLPNNKSLFEKVFLCWCHTNFKSKWLSHNRLTLVDES